MVAAVLDIVNAGHMGLAPLRRLLPSIVVLFGLQERILGLEELGHDELLVALLVLDRVP